MRHISESRRSRRGTYAAIFGVSALMLVGFTALAIDVGWQRVAMTQLGNAADAGAHAGALKLDGTTDGVTAAKARAKAIAEMNLVHQRNIVMDNANIVVGRFDVEGENECTTEGGCWTVMGNTPSGYSVTLDAVDATTANAIYVGADEDVKTFFGLFPFGAPTIGAANYAIARLPIVEAEGQPCAFPMSLPQCEMTEWTNGDPCGKLIRMRRSSANNDNMAWSRPDGAPASSIKEAVATVDGNCDTDYQGGDDAEDTILQNGEVANTTEIIRAQLDGNANYSVGNLGPYNYATAITPGWDSTWGNCPTGDIDDYCDANDQDDNCPDVLPDCTAVGDVGATRMIKRAVTVFDHAGYSCDSNGNVTQDSNYNDTVTTTGFVNLVIYNVYEGGNGQNADKYMDAFISCTDEDGNLRPTDENGDRVVHQGQDQPQIDDPEEGTVALVE